MDLQKRFCKFLQESGCIPSGSRVLVAVSGGADSVALLHLLCQCAESLRLSLVVAHLDHALRGESAEDAAFVEELCAGLNIPVVFERQDVATIAVSCKGNLEEVARQVRREFLERVARGQECDMIALGQHADDQAETFLMRLIRGSGSAGLVSMKVVSGKFVRPLLSFCREDLVRYLQSNRYGWRVDASNEDLRFTRNRIRHELIPLLESFNPNISSHLSSTCERLNQDENFWSKQVAEQVAECCQSVDDGFFLDREKVINMDPALSGRVVRQVLGEVRGDLRGISSVHIVDILELISAGPVQGELNLPTAWVARRYDKILFMKDKPVSPVYLEMTMECAGSYLLPDGRTLTLSLEKCLSSEHINAVEFRAGEVGFPLTLRHCRPGDRIKPSGMSGSKKLQDLFVDQKLDREQRQSALLLAKGEEILWVVGIRRCEGARPVPGEEVLRVEILA